MIVDHQVSLFGVEIEATISDQRAGSKTVTQCAQCGLLVVAPDCGDYKRNDPLGACPRCGYGTWWRQHFPVGGLTNAAP